MKELTSVDIEIRIFIIEKKLKEGVTKKRIASDLNITPRHLHFFIAKYMPEYKNIRNINIK